jgi:hypothetical protein
VQVGERQVDRHWWRGTCGDTLPPPFLPTHTRARAWQVDRPLVRAFVPCYAVPEHVGRLDRRADRQTDK